MSRVVPGSGAIIKPNFNKEFGVASVDVISGGSGYSQLDPPRLTIDNCGTPAEEALLYPYIDSSSGKIVYVRVLEPGRGYDPLRVVITPQQDSITVVDSFNPNIIWTSANTSVTSGRFTQYDRLKVVTNGLPDPAPYNKGGVYATPYQHTFIFRGGKDVPNYDIAGRIQYNDSPLGIMANGVELHAPGFYDISAAESVNSYTYDVVKTPTLLSNDIYGGVTSEDSALEGKYFYTSYKLKNAFAAAGSVFDITKYYKNINYQGDKSRHSDGHSKILGYAYDGYPIYGPYGYSNPLVSGTVSRLESSYRLKNSGEVGVFRPVISDESTTTYTITVAPAETTGTGNRYYVTGGGFTNAEKQFLNLQRGNKYIFNQDSSTNTTHSILFSPFGTSTAQGWHTPGQTIYDVNALWTQGVKYYLENVEVTYTQYTQNFNTATLRRVELTVPVEAPNVLYYFCYNHINMAERLVIDGYPNGTFVEDNVYEDNLGDLDEHNGRYCVTPEYPNGTYAYFATIDSSNEPVYPYFIGPTFFGKEYLPQGELLPEPQLESPRGAIAEAVIDPEDTTGEIAYINVKSNGDGYFGPATVNILGGEGSGADAIAVTQTVTGAALLQEGRNYLTAPNISFQGGGGSGAKGVAYIDPAGKLTDITINNPGQYYQIPPYVLIDGGGGIGARAKAIVSQGQVTDVIITEPGEGYTSAPQVIFTKLAVLKRKVRNRQAFNSVDFQLCGLATPVNVSQNTIYVDNTDSFPGSGTLILGNEIVRYTSKSTGRFLGLTRALNFRFDQRIILDTDQDDPDTGISTYQFSVGDRVVRRVTNSSSKIAIVYDWKPESRELFVKFVVDDLAFIDAGIPSSEERTIAFDGGIAESSLNAQLPHETESNDGSFIKLFVGDPVYNTKVTPQVVLTNTRYVDDDEDGLPDVNNDATAFENQISLDGGLFNSLYGIEETVGGTNTTLFQVGDGIQDSSIPSKIATVDIAGALGDGVEHDADVFITVDSRYTNNISYFPGEIVTGEQSGIEAEVVAWNPVTKILHLTNIVPYDTGDVNLGINGKYYTFSKRGSIIGMKVVNAGTNYTAAPTISIETVTGYVSAEATAVMTAGGDQIESVTMDVEGYGYNQYVEVNNEVLHPTVTVTNAPSDTTGDDGALEAILGGEFIVGNNGARWRIKDIEYQTLIRNEFSE